MSVKKYLRRNQNLWISVLLLVVVIKIFSLNRNWVEELYTSKFYFFFSEILRLLFGWIPFSLGDILYLIAGCWLFWKLIKNIRLLFQKKLTGKMMLVKGLKLILILTFIYIVFNILWGINYNRKGIANQLALADPRYDTSDLIMLQQVLLQKVNSSKSAVVLDNEKYPSKNEMFQKAKDSYKEAQKIYPFLQLNNLSVKSSLYSMLGNYLGFTGYYNPFTGEAQVNTTVPKFLQPYITTHEIAHQLGYAKENEANFVGYLAAVKSRDTLFHYSAYFELFLYANREVYYFDSAASKKALKLLIPEIKKDIIELRKFNLDHTSFLEPWITWMYGKYLRLNQQPQGIHSYNAVVAMLIAYYKKYGKI
jgi:hypothetical protein